MPAEFTCDGPGIGPLMLVFDAAVDPYLNYFTLLLDPDELGLSGDELVAMAAEIPLGLVTVVPLSLAATIDAAISLPPLPAPFNVGIPVHGWGEINSIQLGMALSAMIAVPLKLIMGMFDESISMPPSLPDDVLALLPPVVDLPGVAALADCISEKLEPIFG